MWFINNFLREHRFVLQVEDIQFGLRLSLSSLLVDDKYVHGKYDCCGGMGN